MRIKNQLFLLLLAMTFSSCFMRINRGFYDMDKSEYNLENAKKQLSELKNGTLIVSIPCEKNKLRLLKNSNPTKYAEATEELNFVKENLLVAMSSFYNYSNYVFIPDSSLFLFTLNNETNHFISVDGKPLKEHLIDTTSNYFILKDLRDFDHLFIYTKKNEFPNQPFPYESTLKINQLLESKEYLKKLDLKFRTFVSEAIYILNKRLTKANEVWN